MSDLHTWVVFIHIAGVLLFLIAHGVSAAVALRLRSERDPGAVRTLVDLSRRSMMVMSVGALIWLVAGIVAGFTGNFWTSGQYWIWASLILALVIIGVMTPWGRLWLNKVRAAVGVDLRTGAVASNFQVNPATLDAAIAAGKPELLATVGFGGFLVILFLMVFKPF